MRHNVITYNIHAWKTCNQVTKKSPYNTVSKINCVELHVGYPNTVSLAAGAVVCYNAAAQKALSPQPHSLAPQRLCG